MNPAVATARFAVGCALLATVTTGCTAEPAPDTRGGPSGPTSEVGPPSNIASPTIGASPTPGPACPVTTDVLFTALKANPSLLAELPAGVSGLKDPVCVLDWAAATTVVSNADPALVVFRYNPAAGTWGAMKAGTSGACNVHGMPEDVKLHLPASCRG